MKLLPYFSLLSDCHSSLFCKESVISVFYPRLPQSFDQNTKQNKTPCSRVSSKNKENICLQSHLSLFFLLKKMLSVPAQIRRNRNWIQGQRFLMWKEKRFKVFTTTLWAKQKVILISVTPRDYQLQFIVSCLRPIKLRNLVLTRAACIYLCFSPLLVSSPKQSVFIFERVTSKKTKFSNSYSFPASKKIYFWFSKCSKFSDKKEL